MKSHSLLSPIHKYPQYQTAGWLDVYSWLQKSAPAWPSSGRHAGHPTDSENDLQHLSLSPSVYSPYLASSDFLSKSSTRLRDQISIHHILAHTDANGATFEDIIGLAKSNIDKDRLAMSTVAANQAMASYTEYKQTGGSQFVINFLYIGIIKTIGDSLNSAGLKTVFNEPLLTTSLPDDLYSNPKTQIPNLSFGLCASHFTEPQQHTISNYASQYLISPSTISAFLLIVHNDTPSSITDSDNQAARNATALLCAQRQLSVLANCAYDSDNVDQLSWVFSLTLTTSEARLNFHFIEPGRDELYYHMHCLRRYNFECVDDIRMLQRHLWNVLDHGVQYRRYHVVETLELLDDKAEGWR